MSSVSLEFARPRHLEAMTPPESRGLERDQVRLLVSGGERFLHHTFRDLAELLTPGDLLIVNESATVPASLPARSKVGEFRLNLCTDYGGGVWLAEPRWDYGVPGPVPLVDGEHVVTGSVRFHPLRTYPRIDRLWFFRAEGDVRRAMFEVGRPIRYGYVTGEYPLRTYQTVFSRVPGSAEMPSAGRPFTARTVEALHARGIGIASIVLHTGVSSLESDPGRADLPPVVPEPFEIPAETAERVNATRRSGHRVIAVGTTVLRALETAWGCGGVAPLRGFTQLVLAPGRVVHAADGLLTGFHDARTSHLALLFAFAGEAAVRRAYDEAARAGYLWHEFGDSHLLWRSAA